MDLVSAQQTVAGWLSKGEQPKWLSGFISTGLPQVVAVLLVLFFAHQLAALTWQLFPQPAETSSNLEVAQPNGSSERVNQVTSVQIADKVAAMHLFGRAGQAKPVVMQERKVEKAPETNLNLTLHGVFTEADPKQGTAIIGKSGSKQEHYKVGDRIMTGVSLQEVYADRVVLLRNQRSEVLKFPKSQSIGQPNNKSRRGKPSASLDPASSAEPSSLRDYRDMFTKEPLKLLEHVRFVPVRRGNTLRGYRLLPQRDRSLYNKLGIRPSDLVTAVNGVSLSNNKEALGLINQLKDAQQIEVSILRKGNEQSLTLSLE
jgi:general secretion pathway protein C